MSATAPFSEFEKPLSGDAGRSYTMPARYYTEPDIYEREKEAIFARTWHYIGHESHVRDPGDYLTLEIADEAVFVMRGDDGRLRGFFNVCRYRAHRLLSGAGNATTIVCPYHAWSYHCDGRLRHARFAARTTSIWRVPGAANLFVLAMMPGGQETTVFSGHRYAFGDAPDPACTAYLNETLGPEDQGLCESVKQGLKSRSYDQGRFMVDPARSGTAEHGLHQLHRLVTRALNDRSDR